MGILLLLILSLFFGWVFCEHKNRELEQLQSELNTEKELRRKDAEEHSFVVKKLQATIRELL